MSTFLTISEAANWATLHIGRKVSTSNISYLLQYGKITKHKQNARTVIDLEELEHYYAQKEQDRKQEWAENESEHKLNWALSFDQYTEAETTKHVHKLHPYKGKFIPQLVEYFLDAHTDEFKTSQYFSAGDTVLDPFAGSGTTLVAASELGIHSIGVDISKFNCLLMRTKLHQYHVFSFNSAIIANLTEILHNSKYVQALNDFEKKLDSALSAINADKECLKKIKQFMPIKHNQLFSLLSQPGVSLPSLERLQEEMRRLYSSYGCASVESPPFHSYQMGFYSESVFEMLQLLSVYIDSYPAGPTTDLAKIILSRVARSSRATTHSDLVSANNVTGPYYCVKHHKICCPPFSIENYWTFYLRDTMHRIDKFAYKRIPNTISAVVHADASDPDFLSSLLVDESPFRERLAAQKIKGIFTSPPYFGQLNYHEQHQYAYSLFNIERRDQDEIGSSAEGRGKAAKLKYIQKIADVFKNCEQYLQPNAPIFVVANDTYKLYPEIFKRANLTIVQQFERPVLRRTSRDRAPYSEIIFHVTKI